MGRYGFARASAIAFQMFGWIILAVSAAIALYGLSNSWPIDDLNPGPNWTGFVTLIYGLSGLLIGAVMIGAGQVMSALLDVAESTSRLEQTNDLLRAIGDETATANTRLKEIMAATRRTADAVEALTQTGRKS